MINTYKIRTCMGKTTQKLSFLTEEENEELNVIGYSGRTSKGEKMSREEYLNSLNKGEFKVEQTVYDKGDFCEEFIYTRVLNERKETGKKLYRAGNILRGHFEGEFESMEEAWSYLSRAFMLAYPTDKPNGRRQISLRVREINPYGFEEFLTCKLDYTELNDLTPEEVKAKLL